MLRFLDRVIVDVTVARALPVPVPIILHGLPASRADGICAITSLASSVFRPDAVSRYVDDEALIIIAKTAALLDKSIDIMLSTLVDTFSKFSLKINWAPGKTEMMLKYRGKHAAAALERRRVNGAISVALPANADAGLLREATVGANHARLMINQLLS